MPAPMEGVTMNAGFCCRACSVRRALASMSVLLRWACREVVPVGGLVSGWSRFARFGIWTGLAAGSLARAVVLALPEALVAQATPAMRSAAAALFRHAGVVELRRAKDGRACRVRVRMRAAIGAGVAR